MLTLRTLPISINFATHCPTREWPDTSSITSSKSGCRTSPVITCSFNSPEMPKQSPYLTASRYEMTSNRNRMKKIRIIQRTETSRSMMISRRLRVKAAAIFPRLWTSNLAVRTHVSGCSASTSTRWRTRSSPSFRSSPGSVSRSSSMAVTSTSSSATIETWTYFWSNSFTNWTRLTGRGTRLSRCSKLSKSRTSVNTRDKAGAHSSSGIFRNWSSREMSTKYSGRSTWSIWSCASGLKLVTWLSKSEWQSWNFLCLPLWNAILTLCRLSRFPW